MDNLPDVSDTHSLKQKRVILDKAMCKLYTHLGFSPKDKTSMRKKVKDMDDGQVTKFFSDTYANLRLQYREGHTEVMLAIVNQLMKS